MWIDTARRTTFFVGLLTIGLITTGCYDLGYNSSQTAGVPSPSWKAFGAFAWGADSLVFVLAAWLAGRSRVWSTWQGRLRAAAYLFAYAYGRMLFTAMQVWLMGIRGAKGPMSFRWPGAKLQDYARPSLDLLTLLMLVWIFVPIFTFTRSRLADKDQPPKVTGTFSISSILVWTTAATVILMWIRFLTWKDVAPETAYSFMTPTQALAEYFQEYFPSLLITSSAIFLVVWSWSGRWWLPVVVFAGALLLDSFGHTILFALIKWTTGEGYKSNVLTGPALERWSYLVGRIVIVWIAFGVANVTGVRFQRSVPE
jgi:hypothetical protein